MGRGRPGGPDHPEPAGVRAVQRGELSPGAAVETDEEILDWVGREGETALHPSCTCRMGVDELSVLDPRTMRVHGLEGLRVVDAASMPYVTADLILGNVPLPPEPVAFYRRPPQGAAQGPDDR